MPDLEKIDTVPPLPPRPADGHKGLFGRVLVVGGSDAMLGAPVLAATAALRMGSGLVQVALPAAMVPFALSITPELTSLPLPERPARAMLADAAEKCDALVVGPGLGKSRSARARVLRLIQLDKPMVLDADALNILSEEDKWPPEMRARAVLTPHPGEMARLGKLFGRTDVPSDE